VVVRVEPLPEVEGGDARSPQMTEEDDGVGRTEHDIGDQRGGDGDEQQRPRRAAPVAIRAITRHRDSRADPGAGPARSGGGIEEEAIGTDPITPARPAASGFTPGKNLATIR
jgi:hypothetical protein